MKCSTRIWSWVLAVGLAVAPAAWPWSIQAKGYSSHGHSYSSSGSRSGGSHSFGFSGSRSSGSGSGGKSFRSGGGKSYSSGSNWGNGSGHGYDSAKSYSSGLEHLFTSGLGSRPKDRPARPAVTPRQAQRQPSGFAFDTAAARARQEEASRQEFKRFKDAQSPASSEVGRAPSYHGRPPPILPRPEVYRQPTYVPDPQVIVSRPARIETIFGSYYSRPVVVYHDPYSSLFWWWLLDRSLEDRAWWAYHHRYDMDPARYQALVANDRQLETRVEQLEAQQAPRDPAFTPAGLGRDLMYSDHFVAQAYSNRPTLLGVLAFWVLGIPLAAAFCAFFIWLIWFKRWQTAT